MATVYLVTGATGHLGNTILRQLSARGDRARAFVTAGDKLAARLPHGVQVFEGDVRCRDSMRSFFNLGPGDEAVVIHCAGIVSIASRFDETVFDVNVRGTNNVLRLCREYKVKKLVHVSSVHAIPEKAPGEPVAEVNQFSPDMVTGLYAKTKAKATALVLRAAQQGLDASVVHPSGICGPFDFGRGHLTQLVADYYTGRLKAGVEGGYDFVDVRDVAAGTLACCEKGKPGECYILSNRYFSLPEVFRLLHVLTGKPEITTLLPMGFAKATAPLSEVYYKLLKEPPLYTSYSLYTLSTDARFTHQKATSQLGYTTRPFAHTLTDTVDWLKGENRI